MEPVTAHEAEVIDRAEGALRTSAEAYRLVEEALYQRERAEQAEAKVRILERKLADADSEIYILTCRCSEHTRAHITDHTLRRDAEKRAGALKAALDEAQAHIVRLADELAAARPVAAPADPQPAERGGA